jgi:hypothetical protein
VALSGSVSVIRVARPGLLSRAHERGYVIARKGTGTSTAQIPERADLCSAHLMPLAGAEVPKFQVRTASPLLCRPPALGPHAPAESCSLFLSTSPAPLMPCRILAHASRASWSKRTNSPVGRFGCDPFLPRAFSEEMQLTRSQVDADGIM